MTFDTQSGSELSNKQYVWWTASYENAASDVELQLLWLVTRMAHYIIKNDLDDDTFNLL